MKSGVFVIAEAGVNHNGDIEIAKKLIDAAKYSGADAVKFQTWITDDIVTKDSSMAEYQKNNLKSEISQYEMLKNLELDYSDFRELKRYSDDKGITFLSTADEEKSASFLNEIQDIFKIGSGEITNEPLLRHIARFNKNIILSTGMCYLSEVESAISFIVDEGFDLNNLTVLHATTDYPTAIYDVNLNAMNTISQIHSKIKVGYSDHTLSLVVPVTAVGMGASVIEKHITLDKNMEGPDHKASLDPKEFKKMVDMIREAELCLGSDEKVPTEAELDNRKTVRKSITAACDIKEGEKILREMIQVRRPGTGLPPTDIQRVVNTVSSKAYQEGDVIVL